MGSKKVTALAVTVLFACQASFADFKYSETTKITGGAMMSAVKMVGVFSKDSRKAMEPTTHTVAIKGNKMRTENSDGSIEIIDLDGRRFIRIDPNTQTYGIMTFDEMKKAMEQKRAEMEAKMKEEQAKHGKQDQANLKITPKFESKETGQTKLVLGLPSKEVKARVEMIMESTDPKAQGQQMSTVVNSDEWIAQDVPGYHEIRDFYMKMAKEMDWVPGQMGGMMANSGIQLSMSEMRKNQIASVTGMPMLTYTSMTMAANGQDPNAQAAQQQQQQQQQEQQAQQDNSIPTSPSGAVIKGLGGMFGHKKNKQQDPEAADPNANQPNPASTPGSLMDMSTEVTSYSSAPLDASMFEPPAGYTQKQVTADDALSGKH
jgi:hypothetical protein